jgi:hypothetical protein
VTRTIAWLLVAVVATACAPTRIELDPRVRAQLPAAPVVHVVVYPTDPPPLMTAAAVGTGSLFGAIGGVVVAARAAELGKELMARHQVEALSLQLANALTDELKATLPNLQRVTAAPAGQEVDDLKKAGLLPFVLDVRAAGTLMYYASNFARYRLLYAARARLVDTEQGRVLWQGVCDLRGADDPAQSLTLAEVEAPDGVTYRRLITDATSQCAAELLKQYRGQAP